MKNTLKSFLALIGVLIFLGCNEQQKEIAFESIDYSCYEGFFKSIKVLENGEIYICYDYNSYFSENISERKQYFSLTLDKVQLDSISELVNNLFSIKVDSVYDLPSDRYISFSFIIKSKKNTFQTTYSGGYYLIKKLKPLYDLAFYLNDLSAQLTFSSDSVFVFESRNRLLLPPPPSMNEK